LKQPAIQQINEFLYFAENNNLSAILTPETMTVQVKNLIRTASAGYQSGVDEWMEYEQKKHS